MLKDGDVQEEFIEGILGDKTYKYATYWKQMVFTGRGIPPKALSSEKDVLSFISSTPGAIGYISRDSDLVLTGVNIVKILPNNK